MKVELAQFSGPLELLMLLVLREELKLFDISISSVISQLIGQKYTIDEGADAIALLSQLLDLKTSFLLPKQSNGPLIENIQIEENSNIFESLVEYYSFRRAVYFLNRQENEQQKIFFRSRDDTHEQKEQAPLIQVSLHELVQVLNKILESSERKQRSAIRPPRWTLKEKILWLEKTIAGKTLFFDIFYDAESKEEIIILFLALLELLKEQKMQVVWEKDTVCVMPNKER